MNIIDSLDARVKNYYIKHFDKTRYGKELRKLKNSNYGKRCFLVGNGPSLNVADLNMLKKEFTFAFNRIYYIFNKTEWRPTYYCIQDDKMLIRSIENIKKSIETKYIFAPIDFKWYYNLDLETNYYFCQKRNTFENRIYFSEFIDRNISVCNTVTYTAIQIAIYMGFTEIYLIGVDHTFNKELNSDGKIIYKDVKNYFCDEYDEDKNDLYIPQLSLSTKAYERAASYIMNFPNVHIYNATRGGELEVFKRIDFDSLF